MTTLSLPPERREPALQLYTDLIKRIKAKIQSTQRCVYDPETGIQKWFLDGKLTHVIQVRNV